MWKGKQVFNVNVESRSFCEELFAARAGGRGSCRVDGGRTENSLQQPGNNFKFSLFVITVILRP